VFIGEKIHSGPIKIPSVNTNRHFRVERNFESSNIYFQEKEIGLNWSLVYPINYPSTRFAVEMRNLQARAEGSALLKWHFIKSSNKQMAPNGTTQFTTAAFCCTAKSSNSVRWRSEISFNERASHK
jgi:hypothetical protein